MELENQVKLMDTYPCKGGNTLLGITSKVITYMDHPELRDRINLSDTYDELKSLQEYYNSIPFNKLLLNPELAPLFIIRDLLDKFSKKVMTVVDEPTEEAGKELDKLNKDMWFLGEIYNGDSQRKVKELRKIQG